MRDGLRPAFAVTMFFVGTLVRPSEVRIFLAAPHRALIGLLGQYTIMPLCAYCVSLFFEDPAVRAGIVLVGCMPGAMASNVMTALLRGDLILSVTMTTVITMRLKEQDARSRLSSLLGSRNDTPWMSTRTEGMP